MGHQYGSRLGLDYDKESEYSYFYVWSILYVYVYISYILYEYGTNEKLLYSAKIPEYKTKSAHQIDKGAAKVCELRFNK